MHRSTKRLCRSGIIAALYIVLTYAFAPVAFGGMQMRPAEALCLLPLFFPEAIPALAVGCAISNLSSPYFFYDVVLGSLSTLFAAYLTRLVGKKIKREGARVLLGGIFPVLINAFLLPFIILFLYGTGNAPSFAYAYFFFVFCLTITQSIWVYGLGVPLYLAVRRLRNKSNFLTE